MVERLRSYGEGRARERTSPRVSPQAKEERKRVDGFAGDGEMGDGSRGSRRPWRVG